MSSGRLTGKYGSLFLHLNSTPLLASASKFADTYDIRWETEAPLEDCTRKGEGFSRKMPGIGSGRLTCKAVVQGLSALAFYADNNVRTLIGSVSGHSTADPLPDLVRCAFRMIILNTGVGVVRGGTANAGGSGTPVTGTAVPAGYQMISGYGWISRASISAVFDQKVEEEITIEADGDWLFETT